MTSHQFERIEAINWSGHVKECNEIPGFMIFFSFAAHVDLFQLIQFIF